MSQPTISDPQPCLTDPAPYTTYLITYEIPPGQTKTARRRYREFDLLREILLARWPGVYIPPVASKKIAGNTEERFIELRMLALQRFFKELFRRKYLGQSDIVKLFLEANNFEQASKQLPPQDFVQTAELYAKHFEHLSEGSSNAELLLLSETDYDFLKNSQKKLEKIRDQIRNVSELKAQYDRMFSDCFNSVLPDYETEFMIDYVHEHDKLILDNSQTAKDKLSSFTKLTQHNYLDELTEDLTNELKQVRGLIEAVETRKKAENDLLKMESKRKSAKAEVQKLKQGKMTFKSLFSAGDKDGQILKQENIITDCQKNQQALSTMLRYVNGLIQSEIASFKSNRLSAYGQRVKLNACKQLQENLAYAQFLEAIHNSIVAV